MDSDKKLKEQLERAHVEIEKYKDIVVGYEKDLNKAIFEYESLKTDTTEVKLAATEIKKEMQGVIEDYNFIRHEYIALEAEFINIVNLSEADPTLCIKVLREYANKLKTQSKLKEVEIGRHDNHFRVIQGGKKD